MILSQSICTVQYLYNLLDIPGRRRTVQTHVLCAQSIGARLALPLTSGYVRCLGSDNNGGTALHAAALHGQTESIRVLVEELGANIAATQHHGVTALHSAAGKGHTQAVRMLVGLGLDVNVVEGSGRTALHVAAEYGQVCIRWINHILTPNSHRGAPVLRPVMMHLQAQLRNPNDNCTSGKGGWVATPLKEGVNLEGPCEASSWDFPASPGLSFATAYGIVRLRELVFQFLLRSAAGIESECLGAISFMIGCVVFVSLLRV